MALPKYFARTAAAWKTELGDPGNSDLSDRAAIAILDAKLPKEQPVPVTFVVAVQARSPRPFRFAGMKASFRNQAMEKVFEPFDPCEIDSSACADDEDQPDNASALREGRGYLYKQ